MEMVSRGKQENAINNQHNDDNQLNETKIWFDDNNFMRKMMETDEYSNVNWMVYSNAQHGLK